MPETTLCAYCASVIPAAAKTCPMCGADVAPDYLEPPTLNQLDEADFAALIPPASPPLQSEPLAEPELRSPEPRAAPFAEPVPAPRVIPPPATPAASSNRSWIILAAVMGAVVVCLCLLAVLLTVVARS